MMKLPVLLLAMTLAQARTALDHSMASVNGKIAYNNLLDVRIARDRAVGNAAGLAADTAKKKANWQQLQGAWQQWSVAYSNFVKAKPKR